MKAWAPTPKEYDLEEARIVTWFITGLRHEAIRLTKKYRGLHEHELLILNEQLGKEEGGREIREMVDTLAAKSDTQAQAEENLFLQEAFSILTPLQKKVIAGAIFEGTTEQEIAQELGITHQCVHKLKERGLNRLRKRFVPEKSHRQVEPYPGRTTTLT